MEEQANQDDVNRIIALTNKLGWNKGKVSLEVIEFLQCCSEAVVQIWKVAECRENRNESSLEEMKNAFNSYYLIIELHSSTYSNQLNLYYSRTL